MNKKDLKGELSHKIMMGYFPHDSENETIEDWAKKVKDSIIYNDKCKIRLTENEIIKCYHVAQATSQKVLTEGFDFCDPRTNARISEND
mgnify:CR=1 FL=1